MEGPRRRASLDRLSRSRLLAPLLRTHGVDGEMTEFEVPIRLARALMALAEETGTGSGRSLPNGSRPQAADAPCAFAPFQSLFWVTACLRQRGACGKNR